MWINCICGTWNLSRVNVSINTRYRFFQHENVEIAFFLEWIFFLYSGVHGRMGWNPNYCEIFTVISSVTRTLLNERYKFRTIKYWFYLIPTHIYVLGSYEFKCFVYPTSLCCASHFAYICTIAIENIRNIQAFSTSQFADVLLFYDNQH